MMKRVAIIAVSAIAIALNCSAQGAVADTVQNRGNIVARLDNFNRRVVEMLAEGNEASTKGSSRFKVIFLPPPLGNLPDYGFALGVGACGLWKTQNDPLLYTSRLPVSVKFGLTDPFSFEAGFQPTLYFNRNALKVSAKFFYRHRNEHYFGIGYADGRAMERDRAITGYQSRRLGITPEVEWRLGHSNVYFGAVADFGYEKLCDAGSYVAQTAEYMKLGGTAKESSLTDVGAGIDISIDTRNDMIVPRQGFTLDARALFYAKAIGSDFNYTRITLDYRHYATLGGRNSILSWGAVSSNVLGGDVPFARYANVGDCYVMRGYYGYQFRDKSVLKGHVEYRYMLNFDTLAGRMLLNRFGVAAWSGIAFTGRNVVRYDAALPEVGAGFRVKVTPRSHLRFDWGYGTATRDVMFYVGINELF